MQSAEEGNVYENKCQYGTGGAEQQDVADIMSGYALPYLVGCRACVGEFIRLPRQRLRVWHVLLHLGAGPSGIRPGTAHLVLGIELILLDGLLNLFSVGWNGEQWLRSRVLFTGRHGYNLSVQTGTLTQNTIQSSQT